MPFSAIPEESIASAQTAKENVRQAIAIVIAQRDAAPVFQNAVCRARRFGQNVGKLDSRVRWRDQRKSPMFSVPLRQRCPAPEPLLMPLRSDTLQRAKSDDRQESNSHLENKKAGPWSGFCD